MAATYYNLIRRLDLSAHERDIDEGLSEVGRALSTDPSLETYLARLQAAQQQFAAWRAAASRFYGTPAELDAVLQKKVEIAARFKTIESIASMMLTRLNNWHDHTPEQVEEDLQEIEGRLTYLKRILISTTQVESSHDNLPIRHRTEQPSQQSRNTSLSQLLSDTSLPRQRSNTQPVARAQSASPRRAPTVFPVNRKRYKTVIVENRARLHAGDRHILPPAGTPAPQPSEPPIPTVTTYDLLIARDDGFLHAGNVYETAAPPAPPVQTTKEMRRNTDFSGNFNAKQNQIIGSKIMLKNVQVNVQGGLKRRATVATMNPAKVRAKNNEEDVIIDEGDEDEWQDDDNEDDGDSSEK